MYTLCETLKENIETVNHIINNEDCKLDNPVWYSLNETHKDFCLEYGGIKFYNPDYCPFGSSIEINNSIKGISEYSKLVDTFYIFGGKPLFNIKITLKKELICHQMVLKTPIDIEINEQIIELKSKSQKNDLFDLVNLVYPDYFRKNTADLGTYFGIYKNGDLVAVTGERMKMNEFTEISAVVTHPEHRGMGYAKQLIKHTSHKIFNENKIPFLHVVESNIGAIGLYQKLGFISRRKISAWNLELA